MGHLSKQSAAAYLCVILMTSFTLKTASGFNMMPEEQLRELTRQGHTSIEYMLSLVMMGLPDSIVSTVMRNLQFARSAGNSGNLEQGDIAPQDPFGDGISADAFASNDPIQLKRKKRFSDNFFNSGGYNNAQSGFHFPSGNAPSNANSNNYHNFPSSNQGSSHRSSSSSFNSNFFDNFNFGRRECPKQLDQGAAYQYASDPATYPAVDIANELFARSLPGSDLLFQCLSRQIVFPSDPPQIVLDDFLATANTTCRSEERQLWSYESVTFTGRCYPLVNFQETPFYKNCTNRFCKCKNDNFFFDNKANVCITEYETVSLWSYCESLLPNRRIVRDRILVPDACTCTTVQCRSSYHHFKK